MVIREAHNLKMLVQVQPPQQAIVSDRRISLTSDHAGVVQWLERGTHKP